MNVPAKDPIHGVGCSQDLVLRTLVELEGTGIEWAVLHNEEQLASGQTNSDVDIVVDRPCVEVYRTLVPRLIAAGAHPVMLWPYDVGALTLFVLDQESYERVQLDLTFDPTGRGKYGLKTSSLLAGADRGLRWPRVTKKDELLYELRKRIVKRDWRQVQILAQHGFSTEDLVELASHRFGPLARKSVIKALTHSHRHKGSFSSPAYFYGTMKRYVNRARHPTGFWVHLETEEYSEAELLYRQLLSFLPQVVLLPQRPNAPVAGWHWWVRNVFFRRARPVIIVSWGGNFDRPDADCILSRGAESGQFPRQVALAMRSRVLSSLGLREAYPAAGS